MRSTPEIPNRFRTFQYPGYTNVFSLLPDCPRFYATETLFGDWDAATLLLAKDAAPTSAIIDLAVNEGQTAWRHSERAKGDTGGWRTNERLVELASCLPSSKLYGSATANLLCDKPGWSRSLPGFRSGPVHNYLCDALDWVIGNMPNLKAIACIGQEAWFLTSVVLGRSEVSRQGRTHRDKEQLIIGDVKGRSIAATCHFHPSRGSRTQWQLGWAALAEHLRSTNKVSSNGTQPPTSCCPNQTDRAKQSDRVVKFLDRDSKLERSD